VELIHLVGEAGYRMMENHYAARSSSASAVPVPLEGTR
jgi:hypothetical protein